MIDATAARAEARWIDGEGEEEITAVDLKDTRAHWTEEVKRETDRR